MRPPEVRSCVLKSFRGGVHPRGHKEGTRGRPIRVMPEPERVVIPLHQHTRGALRADRRRRRPGRRRAEDRRFEFAALGAGSREHLGEGDGHRARGPPGVSRAPVPAVVIETRRRGARPPARVERAAPTGAALSPARDQGADPGGRGRRASAAPRSRPTSSSPRPRAKGRHPDPERRRVRALPDLRPSPHARAPRGDLEGMRILLKVLGVERASSASSEQARRHRAHARPVRARDERRAHRGRALSR